MAENILLKDISTEELKKELDRRMAEISKAKKRFEITGEWSGYTSSQRKIVHREYTTDKDFAKKVEDLGSICYTDGTYLDLKVRQLAYKERKQEEKKTYSDLIRKCVSQNTNRVAELK